MVKCAIKSCQNDTRKHNKHKSSITFHRFPKDRNLMKKWIEAVKQSNWEPNFWSKICSLHFPDSSIYETKNGLRKLTNNAVPSLFLNQSPSDPELTDVPSNSSPAEYAVTSSLVQQCSVEQQIDSTSNVTDTQRTRKLKKEIVRLADIAKRRRLRCNALYAARRRLKKKVENMSRAITELKIKRIINQEQVNLTGSGSGEDKEEEEECVYIIAVMPARRSGGIYDT